MITAVFSLQDRLPCGVLVQGHSGYAAPGADIVCSAVSSAVIFTANALSEALGEGLEAEQTDGRFRLYTAAPNDLLLALQRHLQAIAAQYPRCVRVATLNLNGGK